MALIRLLGYLRKEAACSKYISGTCDIGGLDTFQLGTSALHAAASGAHADTCAVLLRAGVSRDCRTKVERTPLHLAAHKGYASVAALLLQHRAAADCRYCTTVCVCDSYLSVRFYAIR